MDSSPLILLAAGGTGGHLFPAEALGVELIKRGLRVRLVTDARALRYSGLFSKEMIDVVPSEAVLGRANRFLSGHVRAIATSLPGVLDRDPALAGKTTTVGTPMRPAILAAAAVPYVQPAADGPFRLL